MGQRDSRGDPRVGVSASVVRQVMDRHGSLAVRVYVVLADRLARDPARSHRLRELADRTGASIGHVRRVMTALCDAGWVTRTRPDTGSAYTYRIGPYADLVAAQSRQVAYVPLAAVDVVYVRTYGHPELPHAAARSAIRRACYARYDGSLPRYARYARYDYDARLLRSVGAITPTRGWWPRPACSRPATWRPFQRRAAAYAAQVGAVDNSASGPYILSGHRARDPNYTNGIPSILIDAARPADDPVDNVPSEGPGSPTEAVPDGLEGLSASVLADIPESVAYEWAVMARSPGWTRSPRRLLAYLVDRRGALEAISGWLQVQHRIRTGYQVDDPLRLWRRIVADYADRLPRSRRPAYRRHWSGRQTLTADAATRHQWRETNVTHH